MEQHTKKTNTQTEQIYRNTPKAFSSFSYESKDMERVRGNKKIKYDKIKSNLEKKNRQFESNNSEDVPKVPNCVPTDDLLEDRMTNVRCAV